MKHNIFFLKNKICLYGPMMTYTQHKHYLMQVDVTKNILSKHIKIEVIDSNIPHSMMNSIGLYFSIFLDPLSNNGRKLKKELEKRDANKFTINISKIKILDQLCNRTSINEVKSISNDVLNILLEDKSVPELIDKRIKKSIKLINLSESLNIHAADIYSAVGLSESHFNLLFKKSIGIPFRQYILWQKLFRATISVLKGNTFTQAAQEGDFVDSAHFAKTFKSNTGIKLSLLFKNKRFVQVYTEELI